MTREFIVEKDTSFESLEYLDDFNNKMNNFVEKFPKYSYTSKVIKKDDKWKVVVTVNKDEQEIR